MVLADASMPSAPPTPEECDHPAPMLGIMAHEFAPYDRARGPEGVRRTTTYYGPIMGGLPIRAWHCEVCGLLRLDYPDGRREERRLYPGPQPGLLALPSAVAPEVERFGMQARVSGLSAPAAFIEAILPAPEPVPPLLRLPALGAVTWLTVLLLSAVAIGILLGGVLAVYDYQTPDTEKPLFFLVLTCFLAAIGVQILAAAFRHWFPMPRLAPSPAVALRGRPAIDLGTGIAIALLMLAAIGLCAGGALAVFSYSTPDAERPLFFGVLACFLLAPVVLVLDAIRRAASRR